MTGHHGRTKKKLHVQTTHNYHEQLKTWTQRGLRGGATNYLTNYPFLYRLMTWNKPGLISFNVLGSAHDQR